MLLEERAALVFKHAIAAIESVDVTKGIQSRKLGTGEVPLETILELAKKAESDIRRGHNLEHALIACHIPFDYDQVNN